MCKLYQIHLMNELILFQKNMNIIHCMNDIVCMENMEKCLQVTIEVATGKVAVLIQQVCWGNPF